MLKLRSETVSEIRAKLHKSLEKLLGEQVGKTGSSLFTDRSEQRAKMVDRLQELSKTFLGAKEAAEIDTDELKAGNTGSMADHINQVAQKFYRKMKKDKDGEDPAPWSETNVKTMQQGFM